MTGRYKMAPGKENDPIQEVNPFISFIYVDDIESILVPLAEKPALAITRILKDSQHVFVVRLKGPKKLSYVNPFMKEVEYFHNTTLIDVTYRVSDNKKALTIINNVLDTYNIEMCKAIQTKVAHVTNPDHYTFMTKNNGRPAQARVFKFHRNLENYIRDAYLWCYGNYDVLPQGTPYDTDWLIENSWWA
jgi:hypothetical protein